MSWIVAAWLDCLVCATVEIASEVGDAVVLSDMPGSPSVSVVSGVDDVICPVVD